MKLFISYSRSDLEPVKQLVDILRMGAHDPWFDQQLLAGQDWQTKLGEAIDQCEVFIYALSKTSVESEWCRWEFARAVRQGKPIVPALIRSDFPLDILPNVLQGKHIVNLTEITATGVANLLGGLNNLTVTIPPEDAPEAPIEPKGEPAQAPPTPDGHQITARVTRHNLRPPQDTQEIDADTEVMTVGLTLSRRYRWGMIVIGSAIILTTVFGAFAALPIGCDYFGIACPPATNTPPATTIPTETTTATITPTATNTLTPTLTHTASLTPVNTTIPTETPIPEPTETLPPTPCESDVLVLSLAPDETDSVLSAVNAWLACGTSGQSVTTSSPLNVVAGRHRTYLGSLNRNQLDSVNLYFNDSGQGAEALADIAGYEGAVEMAVIVQETSLTFADLLIVIRNRGIELERYPDIGVNFEYDPGINLYYLVVVFGQAEE